MSSGTRRRMGVIAAILIGTAGAALAGAQPASAVVGGSETSWSDHPYYVIVEARDDGGGWHACGGSVIDADVILTAAHCVTHADGDPHRVIVSTEPATHMAIDVDVHSLWNGDPADGHDLAVVRLTPGSTAGITPVVVGSPYDPQVYAAGTEAWFVGHGHTHDGGEWTTELRELHTVLRSDGDMDDIYNPWYGFDNWSSRLSLGAGFSNHTVCHGDSGGPLTVNRDGQIVQVGVASFVDTWWDDCDEPGGFAELDGAQLAWVALYAPGIMTRWNDCVDGDGAVRRYVATYSAMGRMGPEHQSDGSNRMWSITCGTPIPPPAPPPAPPGPPPPPPPPGPTCRVLRCQEQ